MLRFELKHLGGFNYQTNALTAPWENQTRPQ